jgi:MoaA/NifB/PqqE/SkfB family radical SAM enzyme
MIILRKKLFKYFLFALYRKIYIQFFWLFPNLLPPIHNPHIIGLELTNDCNMQCVHCFRNRMNEKIGYIDVNLFKKLIDEISTYPMAFLRIVGRGEPALHPELKQIMEYLNDKSIKVEFCTNGILFENHSIAEILDWNLDILDISIDGMDKKSYNELRLKGNYDSLKNNIAKFYNTRNDLKRSTPKINIRNIAFPDIQRYQIDEFKKEWLKISDLIFFNTLNPINNPNISFKKYNRCKQLFFSAFIRWNGRIALCPDQFIYGVEQYIGDLSKEEVKEIWKNPELQERRLLHRKRDFTNIPDCKYCFNVHTNQKNINPIIVIPK